MARTLRYHRGEKFLSAISGLSSLIKGQNMAMCLPPLNALKEAQQSGSSSWTSARPISKLGLHLSSINSGMHLRSDTAGHRSICLQDLSGEQNGLAHSLSCRLLRDDTGYAGHVRELRTQIVFKTLKTALISLPAQKRLIRYRERNDCNE
ncbi:hypothetical protein GJ496_001582 [Pomphorhynchus laevis]|nr:hypothetical protein GJ496_001582 [Pomphorhynchus laevis]